MVRLNILSVISYLFHVLFKVIFHTGLHTWVDMSAKQKNTWSDSAEYSENTVLKINYFTGF